MTDLGHSIFVRYVDTETLIFALLFGQPVLHAWLVGLDRAVVG